VVPSTPSISRAPRFGGLWRHADFLKLWGGQTISLFGTLATPYTLAAILLFHATAAQVALLTAARYAPGVVVGLFAGVMADRVRRRPLMIAADIGRALLLGSLPVAAVFGWLSLRQLVVVTLLVSVLTVVFDVAYRAYLPTLVPRKYLVEGNAKLEASAAVAEVAGLGLSGVFLQLLTAPGTFLVDALSFVASAVTLGLIRAPEPPRVADPSSVEAPTNAWREIRAGVRFVFGTPMLRALAGAEATMSLFGNVIGVVILLDWTERLGLSPLVIGLVGGVGGISAFVGAALSPRIMRRWGLGRTLVRAFLLTRLSTFFIVLAGGPTWFAVTLLLTQQVFGDAPYTVFDIAAATVRQSATPEPLLGRMNASFQFLTWTAMLGGIALGGVLGGTVGTRAALLVGTIGASGAALWLVRAPLHDTGVSIGEGTGVW